MLTNAQCSSARWSCSINKLFYQEELELENDACKSWMKHDTIILSKDKDATALSVDTAVLAREGDWDQAALYPCSNLYQLF
jgi:hypothetical protein